MKKVAIGSLLLLMIASYILSNVFNMSPSIQEVKNKYADELMKSANVVSVGIGLDEAGQPAIIIGLSHSDINTMQSLPNSLEGFPVVAQVLGEIKAH